MTTDVECPQASIIDTLENREIAVPKFVAQAMGPKMNAGVKFPVFVGTWVHPDVVVGELYHLADLSRVWWCMVGSCRVDGDGAEATDARVVFT